MDRLRRLFATAAISLALVTIASSQSKNDKKPEAQDQSIQLQSQLLEIHAVVTDRQGHLIKNLKKEDFEIFENNNRQTISFFSAESINDKSNAGNPEQKSVGSQPPVRTVAIYVDTLNLSISSLQWTKQALNKFIDQQLTPGDAA